MEIWPKICFFIFVPIKAFSIVMIKQKICLFVFMFNVHGVWNWWHSFSQLSTKRHQIWLATKIWWLWFSKLHAMGFVIICISVLQFISNWLPRKWLICCLSFACKWMYKIKLDYVVFRHSSCKICTCIYKANI